MIIYVFVFFRKSQASDTEEPGKSLFHALKQKLEYRVRYRTSTTYGQQSGEVLVRIFSLSIKKIDFGTSAVLTPFI
jgi:hypothetical protein